MIDLFNVITIETNNICTRKCWFCKFGQERQDELNNILPWNLLVNLSTELQSLNYSGRISFHGINEPLLDNRILDIIKLFRPNQKAFISFNTNGDLLTDSLLNNLFDAGLDKLGISIYDDLSYKRKLIYFSHPKVKILDMRNPLPKIENRGGNIKNKSEYFIIKNNISCARPFNMCIVKCTGEIALCDSDMYIDVPVGDLKKDSLTSIWFDSPILNKYRKELQTKGRKELFLCKTCSLNGTSSPREYP